MTVGELIDVLSRIERTIEVLVGVEHDSEGVMTITRVVRDTETNTRIKGREESVDPYTITVLLEKRVPSDLRKIVAERDYLRKAIETHRRNVWGDGCEVGHYEDEVLYEALEGGCGEGQS